MTLNRREILRRGGLLLTYGTGAGALLLSPAQAREKRLEFGVLKAGEVETLESLGNVLHQDAAGAGLAHFIDHQLVADPNECLLIAKYFNVPQPYVEFYRAGLAALNALSEARYGRRFAKLNSEQATAIVGEIGGTVPEGWQGPPAPLFYIVVRSDVVDVVYGTVAGFDRLGIPYMPHILPETPW
jgi:hypothetical protein